MRVSSVNHKKSVLVTQSDISYFLFTVLQIQSWQTGNNTERHESAMKREY